MVTGWWLVTAVAWPVAVALAMLALVLLGRDTPEIPDPVTRR